MTAWLDKNHDQVLNAGDEQTELKVHVVRPWTAAGTWTAGQPAWVTANADGASLQQLALDITGVSSDYLYLHCPQSQIEQGTQVDVRPLLYMLEQRIRNAVVARDKRHEDGRVWAS